MRHVVNTNRGILGEGDPSAVWENIIRYIPDEVLLMSGVRILVLAAGYGTEADMLVQRMKKLGKTDQEIRDSIHLIDKYQTFTNLIKKKGYNNIITQNFLEWETDMKFDVVIGNPPYKFKGNNNFYIKFIEKSQNILKDNGIFAFVIPNRFLNPESMAAKQLRTFFEPDAVWTDLSSYFPNIGTNIGTVVGKKVKNNKYEKPITFIFPDGNITKSLTSPTPIMKPTILSASIIEKVFSDSKKKMIVDNDYTGENYIQVEVSYCRYRSTTPRGGEKTLVTNVNHINGNGNIIPCESLEHANVNSWFLSRSKLGRFCIYSFANASFVNINIVCLIMPYLGADLDKNDTTLYKYFNLTPEEIEYIEKVMK